MNYEDLKPLRGYIPGWSIYNKYVKGADYTIVGANKYYPEIVEIGKTLIPSLPVVFLGESPLGALLAYFLMCTVTSIPEEYNLLKNQERLENVHRAVESGEINEKMGEFLIDWIKS